MIGFGPIGVQHLEQAVETHGRPRQGSKIEGSHSHILLKSNMGTSRAPDVLQAPATDPARASVGGSI